MDLAVREGQRVEAGQTLVKIDDRAARLRVDGLRAQIEGVRVERARLRAERKLDQNQADAAMRTRTSIITVREKALAALQADLDFARLELDRSKTLFASKVVNERQLQMAQAAVTKLEIQILQLQAEHEQAEGSLGEARVGHDRLGVIDAQIEALTHQVAALAAQMRQQQVDVDDRTIKSPDSGRDRPHLHTAGGVCSGRPAHPDAAQSGRGLGRGQHQGNAGRQAQARPDRARLRRRLSRRHLRRRVARDRQCTTARFALLPTPNPSGNFTKITQRVPVKIDHRPDAEAADARHDGRSRN